MGQVPRRRAIRVWALPLLLLASNPKLSVLLWLLGRMSWCGVPTKCQACCKAYLVCSKEYPHIYIHFFTAQSAIPAWLSVTILCYSPLSLVLAEYFPKAMTWMHVLCGCCSQGSLSFWFPIILQQRFVLSILLFMFSWDWTLKNFLWPHEIKYGCVKRSSC